MDYPTQFLEARTARGWTQLQLAQRARVARDTVTAIEAGRGVHLSNLQRVAAALGMRAVINLVEIDQD